MNKEALYKVRGDLYAGAMKLHEDTLSITGELELLVDEKDGEEIWNLTEGDSVEVGPFRVSKHKSCRPKSHVIAVLVMLGACCHADRSCLCTVRCEPSCCAMRPV